MRIRYAAPLAALVSLAAQDQPKLTPRELFYTPVVREEPRPTPAPAAEVKPARPAASKPKPQRTAARTERRPAAEPLKTAAPAPDEQPSTAPARPLVLRYSLLLGSGDVFREVDAETVFRSGDAIRVSVESNDDAYLYIVQQGSSKAWNVLFPDPDINKGDNRVMRGRRVEIPSESAFVFHDPAGTERLLLVLTRRPEPDLEKLVYGLSEGAAAAPDAGGESAKAKTMMASSRPIGNELIAGLRSKMVARDLVFEKITDKNAGSRKEKAMYVMTATGGQDARLVVELNLNHR